jgi:DNA-binding transcriptional MerR regulator
MNINYNWTVRVQGSLKSSETFRDETLASEEVWTIGETARLFGVRASALRFWEEQGILEPQRRSGRRLYDRDSLRRIALVLTWRDSGQLELGQIRTILNGGSDAQTWQDAVTTRLQVIEEHRRRLDVAHAYLRHLVTCPSERPGVTCHYLAAEVDQVLDSLSIPPRSQTKAGSAAVAVQCERTTKHGCRDEIAVEDTGGAPVCGICGGALADAGRGRRRRYCSPACRQRAYRARARGGYDDDIEYRVQ